MRTQIERVLSKEALEDGGYAGFFSSTGRNTLEAIFMPTWEFLRTNLSCLSMKVQNINL